MWATVDEVAEITGVTPSLQELKAAQSVIDIYSNRTPAASGGISKRDLGSLRQALAWQAVWQAGQAGYETRSTVFSVSQDGQFVQYRNRSDQDLAPLASRALRNLSWKSNRTQRMEPLGTRPRGQFLQDYTLERSDDQHGWKPE